jgi:rhodanese-related sulfurtransferase
MTVQETICQPIQQPKPVALFMVIAVGAALVAALVAAMSARGSPEGAIRGVSAQCDSRACVSPRQIIGVTEAELMKRRLGSHALVVDVRSEGESAAGLAIAADVRAPFIARTGAPGLEFRLDFADKVDEALRAARMKHDEPVILVSRSLDSSVLAALLLQEHGYSGILVLRPREATAAGRTPPA